MRVYVARHDDPRYRSDRNGRLSRADHEPGIQLGRWHREVEKEIEASGIPWTFVRSNNFMDNFLGVYPPSADGAIRLPFGDGACSFVDTRDVAAMAAAVLTSDGHEGKAYDVTGPEALTITQVAETLSEVTGRAIRYVDVPEEAARTGMQAAKIPAAIVDAMLELYAIDKAGYAARISPDVRRILARQPRSFRDFAREHVERWRE